MGSKPSILLRDTERRGGEERRRPCEEGDEIGAMPMQPQAREQLDPPAARTARTDSPWSLQRERGPADTLTLGFWPPELGENQTVVLSRPPSGRPREGLGGKLRQVPRQKGQEEAVADVRGSPTSLLPIAPLLPGRRRPKASGVLPHLCVHRLRKETAP